MRPQSIRLRSYQLLTYATPERTQQNGIGYKRGARYETTHGCKFYDGHNITDRISHNPVVIYAANHKSAVNHHSDIRLLDIVNEQSFAIDMLLII